MDEAKSLVHLSVSAIFSAMLVAACMGLITIGYMMWSYFSREDKANQRLDYYANLTTYDNQTILGSDILSLLSRADEYGLFVVFFEDTATANHVFDESTSVSLTTSRYVYFDPDGQGAYGYANAPAYSNSIPILNTAQTQVYSMLGGGTQNMHDIGGGYTNLHGTSKADLVHLFTTTADPGLGSKAAGSINSYAAFKSCLIYANDGTTDVVGIALVRANELVTDYCMD